MLIIGRYKAARPLMPGLVERADATEWKQPVEAASTGR